MRTRHRVDANSADIHQNDASLGLSWLDRPKIRQDNTEVKVKHDSHWTRQFQGVQCRSVIICCILASLTWRRTIATRRRPSCTRIYNVLEMFHVVDLTQSMLYSTDKFPKQKSDKTLRRRFVQMTSLFIDHHQQPIIGPPTWTQG